MTRAAALGFDGNIGVPDVMITCALATANAMIRFAVEGDTFSSSRSRIGHLAAYSTSVHHPR